MTRPAVTVVMPFAGSRAAADEALRALARLRTGPGDELLFVDNARHPVVPRAQGVNVIRAMVEHSPAYARNVGAEQARNDWVLFLDADTLPPPDLLDAYFADGEPPADVGALAGEVAGSATETTIAGRYGVARGFLSQAAHLAHPYRPRAVAANLLVRRDAFTQIGGFYEGVRAAEDTDFSWRLQQAGWRLELRSAARVEHVYRSTVRALRRQWRGYAAGRAWLGRRYDGFTPEPALKRALRGRGRRSSAASRAAVGGAAVDGAAVGGAAVGGGAAAPPARFERLRHIVLDGLLAIEELIGFGLSNRPHRPRRTAETVQVVLVADQFPAQEDPLVEFARALDGARVEAVARPPRLASEAARAMRIDYREDDGAVARVAAVSQLAIRHPLRVLRAARSGDRRLAELAPAAIRLTRDPTARLQPLGSGEAEQTAITLAELTGRRTGRMT